MKEQRFLSPLHPASLRQSPIPLSSLRHRLPPAATTSGNNRSPAPPKPYQATTHYSYNIRYLPLTNQL